MPQFLLLIPMSADSFTFKQGNCFIFCHTDRILQLLDTCKRIRSVAVSSDRINSELVLCLIKYWLMHMFTSPYCTGSVQRRLGDRQTFQAHAKFLISLLLPPIVAGHNLRLQQEIILCRLTCRRKMCTCRQHLPAFLLTTSGQI